MREMENKEQELMQHIQPETASDVKVLEEAGDMIEDEFASEHRQLAELLTEKWEEIEAGQLVKGKIIGRTDDEILVSVGFKSEAAIPENEFENPDELKAGDEVEVFVESLDTAKGGLKLSRKTARAIRMWDFLQKALEEDLEVEGKIVRRTKGGFVVDFGGIEAFLPGSQVDVKPIRDYDAFVGKTMKFKVVKINPAQHNVVVSHKSIIEKELEEKRKKVLDVLEEGVVLEGTVKNITNFGVFIDLGGVDGLLKISDISWGRVDNVNDILELDQKVKVVVLSVDEEKTRVMLGMKQLQPHPWESLPEDLQVGSRVKGKVVTITDYGIFVEVLPGVEGIIRLPEFSWALHTPSPHDLFNVGDEVEAEIIELDKENQKMALSIKRLQPDPWEKAAEKYQIGSVHKGIVRNLTEYGAFVELEEGIDGFLHVTELSWTKIVNSPEDVLKKGDEIEVKVIDVDLEKRRIRLSLRQLQEDPWPELEKKYYEGSVHKGKIVSRNKKGAIVEMEDGVQGFCPSALLATPKGQPALKEGDEADFMVKKFDKEHRRILLTHKDTWYKKTKAEEKAAASAAEQEAYKRSSSKPLSVKLGDLIDLQAIKEELRQQEERQKKEAEKQAASKQEEDSSEE